MLHPHRRAEQWEDLSQLKDSPQLHVASPVILVQVDGVPCPAGCCLFTAHIRPNTTDVLVLWDILHTFSYQFLQHIDWQPHTILDAGANIGITAALFAIMFPYATIIAVEPSDDNYQMLLINTGRFGNIHLVKAGLWNSSAGLQIIKGDCQFPRCGHWAIRVQEADFSHADVPGVTVDQLLTQYALTAFDYVKIDIEGSERVIFGSRDTAGWLKECKLVSVDIHGGAATESIVRAFSRESEFLASQAGEYAVFQRRSQSGTEVAVHGQKLLQ